MLKRFNKYTGYLAYYNNRNTGDGKDIPSALSQSEMNIMELS